MLDALTALHGSADINIDQAILHARVDAARLSGCANAVSTHGRRRVTAIEARSRRALAVAPAGEQSDVVKDGITLDALRKLKINAANDKGTNRA